MIPLAFLGLGFHTGSGTVYRGVVDAMEEGGTDPAPASQ
jgi:hypothetical protein